MVEEDEDNHWLQAFDALRIKGCTLQMDGNREGKEMKGKVMRIVMRMELMIEERRKMDFLCL